MDNGQRTTDIRSRSGVSLLEVLISIFVIMVGLLGIAAVIPVGRYTMVEIAKADRSAACGRAAVREVKVRGMVDPRQWRQPDYTNFPNVALHNQITPTGYGVIEPATGRLRYGQSFAIDPVFIARSPLTYASASGVQPAWFPYAPAVPPGFAPAFQHLARVTLKPSYFPDPVLASASDWALFDRILTWQDDLAIPVPRDPAERPRQMMFCKNGPLYEGYALPDPAFGGTPYYPQNQGDYTWMAIVSPAVSETSFSPGPPPSDTSLTARERWLYTISVVVSYKREFTLPADLAAEEQPSERTVTANLLSAGWGGGDVRLTVPYNPPSPYSPTNPPYHPGYLEVRPNQWLMLCGVSPKGRVYRWYRVVAADSEAVGEPPAAPTHWARYVTLAGPDWNTGWCVDSDGDGSALEAAAVISDGVIGVYTTTMELDAQRQAAISGP